MGKAMKIARRGFLFGSLAIAGGVAIKSPVIETNNETPMICQSAASPEMSRRKASAVAAAMFNLRDRRPGQPGVYDSRT